jgi:hypothetical protein
VTGAKHPASDSISEPVTEADVSPRAANRTDATSSRRYIALLYRVAGANAALKMAAVVAATLVFAPPKFSSPPGQGRAGRGSGFVVGSGSDSPW